MHNIGKHNGCQLTGLRHDISNYEKFRQGHQIESRDRQLSAKSDRSGLTV